MTVHENIKLTVERIVCEYNFYNREKGSNEYTYWEVIKMIRNAYEKMNAISEYDAKRYCYQMNCTFDEMMTA